MPGISLGMGLSRRRRFAPQLVAKSAYNPTSFGVADGTTLRSASGWSAINSTNATTSERDEWKVITDAQALVGTTASNDFSQRPGKFIIARDTGSVDHIFKATLTAGTAGSATMVVAGTNELNCAYLTIVLGTGAPSSVILYKRDATGEVQIAGYSYSSAPEVGRTATDGSPILRGDEIAVHVLGQKVHIFVNGKRMTATAGADLDTTRPFTKGTFCGFGSFSTSTSQQWTGIYMAPMYSALQMDASLSSATGGQPAFYPGKPGVGRSIALNGTYTGATPTGLQYRVVNDASGATVTNWTTVSAVIGGGTWSCSALPVPMSDISSNKKYRVDLRCLNDSDAHTMTTIGFAVGLAYGIYGQSNAAGFDNGTATGYTVAGNGYAWTSASTAWVGGASTSAATARLLKMAEAIASAKGIPVGVHAWGVSGTGIDKLNVSGGGIGSLPWLDDLVAQWQGSKANTFGYLQPEFGWVQGEAEANAPANITDGGAFYGSQFDTLMTNLQATGGFLNNATPKMHVAIIGAYTGTQANGDTNWPTQRAILLGLGSKQNVTISHSMFDITHADNFHYTSDGYVELGRRLGLSLLKTMGLGTYNGRGPIITGATRSGATITLAVNLNGASSISGTSLVQYQAFLATDTAFASPLSVSSVAVSGNTIVVTLAADPGAPVVVRSFYSQLMGFPAGGTAPPSPLAIGTYADSTTIPVEPIYVPITSN